MVIPITAFIRSGDTGINEAMTRIASYASSRDYVCIEISGEHTLTAQRTITTGVLQFVGRGKIILDTSSGTSEDYWLKIAADQFISTIFWDVDPSGMGSEKPALELSLNNRVEGLFDMTDLSESAATFKYWLMGMRQQSATAFDTGDISGQIELVMRAYRSGGAYLRGMRGLNAKVRGIGPAQANNAYAMECAKMGAGSSLNVDEVFLDLQGGAQWNPFVFFSPGDASNGWDTYGRARNLYTTGIADPNIIADAGTGLTVGDTWGGAVYAQDSSATFTYHFIVIDPGSNNLTADDIVVDAVDFSAQTITFARDSGQTFGNASFAWHANNPDDFNTHLSVRNISGGPTSGGALCWAQGWQHFDFSSITGHGGPHGDYVIGVEQCRQGQIRDFFIDDAAPSNSIRPAVGMYFYCENVTVRDGTIISGSVHSGIGAECFKDNTVENVVFDGAVSRYVRFTSGRENWEERTKIKNCTFRNGGYVTIEGKTATAPSLYPTDCEVSDNIWEDLGETTSIGEQGGVIFHATKNLRVVNNRIVSTTTATPDFVLHRNNAGVRASGTGTLVQGNVGVSGVDMIEEKVSTGLAETALPEV